MWCFWLVLLAGGLSLLPLEVLLMTLSVVLALVWVLLSSEVWSCVELWFHFII
jgi:hypothetical protein